MTAAVLAVTLCLLHLQKLHFSGFSMVMYLWCETQQLSQPTVTKQNPMFWPSEIHLLLFSTSLKINYSTSSYSSRLHSDFQFRDIDGVRQQNACIAGDGRRLFLPFLLKKWFCLFVFFIFFFFSESAVGIWEESCPQQLWRIRQLRQYSSLGTSTFGVLMLLYCFILLLGNRARF